MESIMSPTRTLVVIAAACASFAGCDIPTEPPVLEQRWILPVDEATMSVDELLPTAVAVNGDAWDVSVDPIATGETLGTLCPACAPLDGLTAPVPAFHNAFSALQGLPADVLSAEVTGGSVHLTITNGLSFDPLEGGGTVTISISDDETGTLLGQVVLDGATDELVPGTATPVTLPLSAGTVTGGLRATTDVDAPGGMISEIDTSDQIHVDVAVLSLLVGSVTVDVQARSVSLDEKALDLEDIDEDIAAHIMSGAVILDVDNPFGVSLDGQIGIGSTYKAFSISGDDASEVELSYSGEELRSFIGQPGVTLHGWGTADGNAVTIQPGQVMTLKATLDFTLEIG
jgi:hypothetical protein